LTVMWDLSERPSGALIALTITPALLLLLVVFTTEGFNLTPSLPFFFSRILPLILSVLAIITGVFTYNLARDEEPEWGEALIFKAVEGVAIAYIMVGIIFITLILYTYFLPAH